MATTNGMSNPIWFLVGLGCGVLVGLLGAPRSGAETREMIQDKIDAGTDYVSRRTRKVRKQASDLVDKGREALNRKADHVKSAFEAGPEAYRESAG